MQGQCTPLHVAAQNGHDSVVKCLILSRADVNAVDEVSYVKSHSYLIVCTWQF